MSGVEFLTRIGQSDGHLVAHALLSEGAQREDAADVELALLLIIEFGVQAADEGLLSKLALANWHISHTDILNQLLELGTEAVVPTLIKIGLSPPTSMDELDAQTYANNAAWALYKIGRPSAHVGLAELGRHGYEATKGLAISLLRRLNAAD